MDMDTANDQDNKCPTCGAEMQNGSCPKCNAGAASAGAGSEVQQ